MTMTTSNSTHAKADIAEKQIPEAIMGQYLTNVVIHVNEALDEAGVFGLEQELCAHNGVISATHQPGRNHLLIVVYAADAICSANLLTPLKARGFHAQLIGF